ncbi:hypothetical protein MBLNU230_g7500t1 [Neophaeotheca triangularis]
MSFFQSAGPRLLRPSLSLRYQFLRRAESTTANTAQKTAKPGLFKSYRRPIIWTTSLIFGLIGGNFVVHTVAPPPPMLPGSREDTILMADLNKRIDNDFKVNVLRGKCLGMAKQLKGTKSGWVEVVSAPEEPVPGQVEGLVHQMAGSNGLGVERLFWDRKEKQLVAVIWFGGSLSGWPGVTHGGAIATAFADKMALAAQLSREDANGNVAAAAVPQRLPGTGDHAKMLAPSEKPQEPSQMSLSYVKPTYAHDFYVIRVSPPAIPLDQDPEHIVPSEPAGGHEYEATLETLDARICAKAKAKFAPSSKLERVGEKVAEGAQNGYAEFKDWMWPSRQKNSQLG